MCVIKIYVLTTLCCCESLTLLLTKIRTGGWGIYIGTADCRQSSYTYIQYNILVPVQSKYVFYVVFDGCR